MSDRACREAQGFIFRPLCRHGAVLLGALLLALQAGCTSRAITVTSLPPGAEVSINRQVVGNTPIRVNYTHSGSYRVELRKDRYQPRVVTEKIRPPLYGYDPLSFFADNVLPIRINDEVSLHYVLTTAQEVDREALLQRASLAREGKVTHPFTQEAFEVEMLNEKEDEDSGLKFKEGKEGRTPGQEGPSVKPDLKVPEPEKPGVKEQRPEGPRLSDELGIKSDEEGKGQEDKDKESKKKKEVRPKEKRTPKEEMLKEENESIDDPDKDVEKK